MLPVVAIVGRPNVGKSTLFNQLTEKRSAIVSSCPGTTRDRQYGEVKKHGRNFIVIDTGGLVEKAKGIDLCINQQALQAIHDADKVLFIVDAEAGVLPEDHMVASLLRKTGKPLCVAANKSERLGRDLSTLAAHELGLGAPLPLSALHGRGTRTVIEHLFPALASSAPVEGTSSSSSLKLAIIGKPNVGKSTLVNRLVGEERVIVHDASGTTRDSILVPLERFGKHYDLIDTAGIRKRTKISQGPEKFSIVKALQAIQEANVVLYVIDGQLGISEQDLKLLGFVLTCGKALVLAINKWDGMTQAKRQMAKAGLDRQLDFLHFARAHYISALYGSGVGDLFASIDEAHASACRELSTPLLTRLLQDAVATHTPPLVKGRRIKLRYAHPGGNAPPRIIIHGNQVNALPDHYRRFLAHFFQAKLKLYGTPVHIEFKSNANPYV